MKLIIDKESSVSIYKQIALQFERLIESGIFKENDKLPTEKELLKENNVAKGTIKHAFDELEKMHYVKKVQGSGTYVLAKSEYNPITKGEHLVKDTFSKLSGISMECIYNIFSKELSKKLDDTTMVNIAWIDCSPEVLIATEKQILKIPNLNVTQFIIHDIVLNKNLFDKSFDIIATTQSHYEELIELVPSKFSRLEKLGLSVSDLTVAEIVRIPDDREIVILYESDDFLKNIKDKISRLDKKNKIVTYRVDCDIKEFEVSIYKAAALIVPPYYKITSNENIVAAIKTYIDNGNKVIPFEYLIDRGSLFHLELKVQEYYEKKFGKREV